MANVGQVKKKKSSMIKSHSESKQNNGFYQFEKFVDMAPDEKFVDMAPDSI